MYLFFQGDVAVEYPYVVVQFLQLPYPDIGDYSCVPHSWIRGRRATDRKSLVAYPDEPLSITKMRIMNGDKPSEKWQLYMAIIKLESHSYENACEFIMERIHNAFSRYSNGNRIDYKLLPATTTKQHTPPLKTIKMSDRQLKKNKNKLNGVNKAKLRDMTLNSRKFSECFNVESRASTSSELPDFVFPENVVMKKAYAREHQDRDSLDVLPSFDNLSLKYPYLQQISEKDNETQVNSLGAGSRSTMEKTLYASKIPLAFINQVSDYSQKLQENQLLLIHRKRLHHLALTRGTQNKRIPNLRTFTFDLPEPLIQDPDIRSNSSFVIQNFTNKANQFSQLEIPESSPVIQEHLQVLPKQKTPDQSSEVECATSEPTTCSKMTWASDESIAYSNIVEHQDSTVEDMVVDELTEVSCIEQNVFSGSTAENESSDNPKVLEDANHSGQTEESSVEKKSPMVEAVASNEVSSSQDVDFDEQSNSSELSSDEILTTSPNSNEQANQSVISLLNQTDVWVDRLFDLFQKMKINFAETCQIARDLHESLVESQKVIERIANASENLRAMKNGKVAVVTSKEVTAEVQQIAEENQAERKEEKKPNDSMEEGKKEDIDMDFKSSENDDDCGGDVKDVEDQDRDKKIPNKIRSQIRSFVLPPEYDPHDTRWTLKYRENDPKLNLVELVPGSSVFINSLRLAHCKLSAKESKELARMLLVEVFSQSALSVCSLTGVRANAFDVSGTNVRPGLDEKARITILAFVKEHALEKNWGPFDSQSVVNTLRSKIQDLRGKHGKTA
uniref:BEN domain protein n=1 Tax=Cotesia sesamiae Kitale bracovirus TaxID=452648 RepID=S0DH24_9VIRU|nr:BEN domain protein [Cotesia sesamiae Kitale bracovirus]